VAPLLIPKVSPPTPKKNTRNKPLRRPEEIPSARAIPPSTPPSHLSVAFLVIDKGGEIQFLITLAKKAKKMELFGIHILMLVGLEIKPRH
jgi:hypothetical protein